MPSLALGLSALSAWYITISYETYKSFTFILILFAGCSGYKFAYMLIRAREMVSGHGIGSTDCLIGFLWQL